MVPIHKLSFLLLLTFYMQCCGYKAADADDLEPREGEIVGVLVDSNGKSDPNSTIELYRLLQTWRKLPCREGISRRYRVRSHRCIASTLADKYV
jgi:hypothetical protein